MNNGRRLDQVKSAEADEGRRGKRGEGGDERLDGESGSGLQLPSSSGGNLLAGSALPDSDGGSLGSVLKGQ